MELELRTTRVLAVSAGVEGLTGLAMLVAPVFVTRLLLGSEISAVAIGLVLICGSGLLALAIAAWPNAGDIIHSRRSVNGLLTYNMLATALLLYLRIRGGWTGTLLWPAVGVHGALTLLIARMWLKVRATD